MDAFENIVAHYLEEEGYWVRLISQNKYYKER